MEMVQDERRKHPRFSDRILAGAQVNIMPCPPLYGEPITGYLTDLSAGGMAIVISDFIPKNVFLKMAMVLPDGFKLESVVTVKRVVKQGGERDYLHGIEFLNPSPEMVEHIELMAADILACNGRTMGGEKEICVDSCSLRKICKRPQCVEKNIRPVLIQLTEAMKQLDELKTDDPDSAWDLEKIPEKFHKYLKAA
jgi:hypothetical protein